MPAFARQISTSSFDLNMPEDAREFRIVFLRFSKDERIILKSRSRSMDLSISLLKPIFKKHESTSGTGKKAPLGILNNIFGFP